MKRVDFQILEISNSSLFWLGFMKEDTVQKMFTVSSVFFAYSLPYWSMKMRHWRILAMGDGTQANSIETFDSYLVWNAIMFFGYENDNVAKCTN